MRCGTFVVPENYALPDGRKLPLKVIVLPSQTSPAKEPLFVLAGGPGQAVTVEAPEFVDAWVRRDHDIVLVDMRGTGEGTKLDCDLEKSAAHPEEIMEPLFHEGRAYAACAKTLSRKADLTQYTTTIAMRDLDDLRKALDYGKINILGGSYGTRAGFVYIHLYPQNVRTAILSGGSPPGDRSPLLHAAAAERALDLTFAQCAVDAACHRAYPDPRGDLDAVMAELKTKPAEVTIQLTPNGALLRVPLSVSAFADGLRTMLYDEDTGRRVPFLLRRARAGDFSEFAKTAVNHGIAMKTEIAMGLLLSVECTQDVSRIDPAEIPKATGNSFIGDTRVRGQLAACSVWPKGVLPKDYAAPFKSDVPVLLISGNLDPVTPPHWGTEMQQFFPNSVHVIAPGAHVSYNQCLFDIEKAFLRTASVKGLNISCIAKEKLPPFEMPAKP